tara:strand:+ start:2505 stop:2822 length:318 start_codon:yes stop_codon:yes gene_type:complete
MIESRIFDQFTYSHFAYGILAYFWGISLKNFVIIHTLYELFEVTPIGVYIINTYFKNIWPGDGKKLNELGLNAIGDTIGAILGWLSAMKLDRLGKKYGWYELHIK